MRDVRDVELYVTIADRPRKDVARALWILLCTGVCIVHAVASGVAELVSYASRRSHFRAISGTRFAHIASMLPNLAALLATPPYPAQQVWLR